MIPTLARASEIWAVVDPKHFKQIYDIMLFRAHNLGYQEPSHPGQEAPGYSADDLLHRAILAPEIDTQVPVNDRRLISGE
ncbi:hypothetical protein AC579_3082 [Pseudocercospora musae]|uniref:Uncharacterized protein n=1 Tax=Pseudocercospora musae TaxID=113226 RepID=A0A139IJI5_9PEZI|nr:hypothetical protein AC579_3082 [Pseudocercospora musae]